MNVMNDIRKTEYVDAHCHILPGVDHGVKDGDTAFSVAQSLMSMGFSACIATPHYYFYEESYDSFLDRRNRSVTSTVFPEGFKVIPGAEIAYEEGISKCCDLSKLAIAGTDRVLIELPMRRLTGKVIEELFDIRSRHGVKPVIAHIERYTRFMSFGDFMELSVVDDIIFQINLYSLTNISKRILVKKMLENELDLVFGTDAHANDVRVKKSESGIERLEKMTDASVFDSIMSCEVFL